MSHHAGLLLDQGHRGRLGEVRQSHHQDRHGEEADHHDGLWEGHDDLHDLRNLHQHAADRGRHALQSG